MASRSLGLSDLPMRARASHRGEVTATLALSSSRAAAVAGQLFPSAQCTSSRRSDASLYCGRSGYLRAPRAARAVS